MGKSPSPDSGGLLEAIERDGLFPLIDAPKVVREITGKPVNKATPIRWATCGLRGVRLRTICCGRARYTKREWLLAFWVEVEKAKRG